MNKEQAILIKKQLTEQISNSNQQNKEPIIEHINKLNELELEQFLKQNNIPLDEFGETGEIKETSIFEQIIAGKISSYKIAENKKAMAILEINPLSRGHCIILPKQNVKIEKIPKTAMSLAQKIAKKIKSKLKPEDIKIETFSFQGYSAINVIPIYKDIKLEKKQASEAELIKLKDKLSYRTRQKRSKTQKLIETKSITLPKLPKRIP